MDPCTSSAPLLRARYEVDGAQAEANYISREKVLTLMESGGDREALQIVSALSIADAALYGADHRLVVFDESLRGMLLANLGERARSRIHARRILGIPPAQPLFRYSDPVRLLEKLAVVMDVEHLDHRSEALYRYLFDMLPKSGGPAQEARSALLFRIGLHHKVTGNWELANTALLESLREAEARFGMRSPRLAEILNHLAVTQTVLCDHGASRDSFVRAIQLASSGCTEDADQVPRYLENYSWSLVEAGLPQEARFISTIEVYYRGVP